MPGSAWKMLPCRTTPTGEQVTGRFACVHVYAAHPISRHRDEPREEWLVVEWPEDTDAPSDHWLSNPPADTTPE